MPLWLLRGRAYLKHRIFRLIKLDASLLPPHEEVLAWLKDEKTRGRRLVLATASDYHQACLVVEPLRLFDTVLGSDGQRNLKGRNKLQTILAVCGKEFDYVGNSRSDLEIWRNCRHAILVNTSPRVERLAWRAGNVIRVFPPSRTGFRDALRSMRFHQWVKNLLTLCPGNRVAHNLRWSRCSRHDIGIFLVWIRCFHRLYSERLAGSRGRPSPSSQEAAPFRFRPDLHRLRHLACACISVGQCGDSHARSPRLH